MSVQFYSFLHLVGVLLVFLAFGSMIARSALQPDNAGWRKLGAIASGVGLLLILVGGFGMLAKLQYGFPGWVIVKLVVWLCLGAMTALVNRKPQAATGLWWATFVLGLVAVAMATFKPF